ncbi:hypothetical protein J6590_011934 [Homalodisca vitripennis]|nr:hypothetical protein J6590_011934 [Homalodisca vitripennis]
MHTSHTSDYYHLIKAFNTCNYCIDQQRVVTWEFALNVRHLRLPLDCNIISTPLEYGALDHHSSV